MSATAWGRGRTRGALLHVPTFRGAFPNVELDEAEMLVTDARVVTARAALAHVDLALAVIRARSPDLAATVARYLLIDDRPSPRPFVVPSQVAHDDEVVKRFERWIRRHIAEPFELGRAALLRISNTSVDEVATAVGYENGTLRALLRRKPHTGLRELR